MYYWRIDCWFFFVFWGMDEKKCPNSFSFWPEWNEKNQLPILIIYTGFALSSVILWFSHSVNFQIKPFVTLFWGTVRPRRLELGTHVNGGQMYCVWWNQADAAFLSLYFFIFLSKIFKQKILSHFSQELWGLEDWNLVHTLGRCIMYTRSRLLLLICLLVSSFFFLCNFQTLKFFVTLFSAAIRSRKLKLGTHMDSGQMYCVYLNQAAALIHPFIFHFSFQFSNIIIFRHTSQKLWGLEGWNFFTHVDNGWMYSVHRNHAAGFIHPSIFSFFFLSSFQALK